MERPFRESSRRRLRAAFIGACAIACLAASAHAADHVDITWMSIANLHLDLGSTRLVADGYITRLPQDLFSGGGGGLLQTSRRATPDAAAVREVFDAIGGKRAVNLLITGHSHFDHSFDTPEWARLSGARIVGSTTTCLQVQAAKIPAARCRSVSGGEEIALGDGVRMFVVRWNHSGDPAKNPEQHDAVELKSVPVADAQGGLRAGVAEDFPNGGGNRAYLFVVATRDGPLSLFFQDSASAVDLEAPIVIDGHDYGAPLANLRRALAAAKLDHVDLWVATGGADVAALVLPVLKPAAYLPVHWDGLFRPFKAGPPGPFSDPPLEKMLAAAGVKLVAPAHYMDRWRLDRSGVHTLDNAAVQRRLGLP
ncbi:MAG TPA: MBL fold metallo-hydrolase [Steroidobacteraceae bacterium]|nr:MBL fold metallo-hydrolase [Steroidobacteraceae bacterium]